MPAGDEPAPGFFEQFARTRAAFRRLIGAHFGLLRAELSEILAELKVLGVQAGLILVLALLAANMLYIGGFLFLGEWLFGSMGWGLAHGVLLAITLIVVVAMLMLGAGRGPILGSLFVAALLTVGLAVLLALNIVHDTARYFAGQLAAPLDTPAAVGAAVGAVLVGVLFLLLLWRVGGVGAGVIGLVVGALLGALFGFLLASPWTAPPAVGFAIMLGLILWPILLAIFALPRLDPAERFGRLKPTTTIETANETKAWLENEWRRRQKKLAKR
ncbi:MAG TPA: hypothetical protein VK992_01130 [Candidatus Caenarcaniphilales bacterium]|nr:hypothetical protein [Candidatus Caenarcaniphilales bacterium]